MLTRSKQLLKLRTMSNISQKVFEFVPIETAQSASDIIMEFKRVSRSMIDYSTILGCLNSLVTVDLIKETSNKMFIRQPIKPDRTLKMSDMKTIKSLLQPADTTPIPEDTEDQEAAMTTKTTTTKKVSFADRMGELTAKMRVLADEIDAVALQFDEELQNKEKQLEAYSLFKAAMAQLQSIGQ